MLLQSATSPDHDDSIIRKYFCAIFYIFRKYLPGWRGHESVVPGIPQDSRDPNTASLEVGRTLTLEHFLLVLRPVMVHNKQCLLTVFLDIRMCGLHSRICCLCLCVEIFYVCMWVCLCVCICVRVS